MNIRKEKRSWKFGERIAFKDNEGEWIHTAVLGVRRTDEHDLRFNHLEKLQLLVCPERIGDLWIDASEVTEE